ncbi:MAG TPA: aminotransferase class V-fold PLP-dependent enzyme [Microbacteriaceae bacterium]|nr:aminotransferase class V-fold PLP-dependent enzyme [Microbacteriaceae bacterium]
MNGFDGAIDLGDAVWSQPWGRVRPGYLDAATMGIPMRATREAMRAAVEDWADGEASAAGYGAFVERARAAYARLVGVPRSEVAIAATTSELVGLIAASLPDGSEVLCVEGDFSSIVYPFMQHAHRGVRVRHVPLEALAGSIAQGTALVAFSLVQSADGRVADATAIAEAAHATGTLTLCDTTQAAGIHPVDAAEWDLTVCHAYKWLCAPRGAAFLTASPEAAERIVPLSAGWYAGEDVWGSTYGPGMALAASARRFDTSPAWLSWVGAAEALEHFETIDPAAAWTRATAFADRLLDRLGLPPRAQAIIALDDPHEVRAEALAAAGVKFARRAGRVRLAFHIWNTEDDLDLVSGAFETAGCLQVA